MTFSTSRFSSRTSWSLEENDISCRARTLRGTGVDLVDLTGSNPTTSGFDYGNRLLDPLRDAEALRYDPQPLGLSKAREAVAQYYLDHEAVVDPRNICLTTSTSEAYTFIFRLLCNPGDEVLIARPSYPLFDFLAQLDDVVLREYPLHYDPNADEAHSWSIDLVALEAAITSRCRAVVVVHPNNPTGNFASNLERTRLEEICTRRGLALIVDEVFLDYSLIQKRGKSFAVAACTCLCFVLSGISKVCGLPQMKVSWIVSKGPEQAVIEAMARLEVVADTFLSMNAPSQLALPHWLRERSAIQAQIVARMQDNLRLLDTTIAGSQIQRLELHGGWTIVLRVPRTIDGIPFAMATLERGAQVQPGNFYGLPEGRVVLSLLTPTANWVRGLSRLPLRE